MTSVEIRANAGLVATSATAAMPAMMPSDQSSNDRTAIFQQNQTVMTQPMRLGTMPSR